MKKRFLILMLLSLFAFPSFSEECEDENGDPNPDGCDPDEMPIDGGVVFLISAAGAYAWKEIRKKNIGEEEDLQP